MATARRNEIVTMDLTLSAEEVHYLIGLLQNDLTGNEEFDESVHRMAIFQALKDGLYPTAVKMEDKF